MSICVVVLAHVQMPLLRRVLQLPDSAEVTAAAALPKGDLRPLASEGGKTHKNPFYSHRLNAHRTRLDKEGLT